ncbi:MAG: DUF1080 domain-containing protein [Phycisphaerales bacterium]|nr:MAG: DUF1080 domain-containing protein [Phycisphaerales bacterium]
MTRKLAFVLMFSSVILTGCQVWPQKAKWQSLFDGETLNGWRASENKDTFSVKDRMIVVDGPRSHLFYVGPVNGANFKDFEFKADVMTKPISNSGIYFHTEYQPSGWPAKGFECQVNTTHSDRKKTGGLYAVQDVIDDAPSVDNQWFQYYIKVEGKHVIIKIDGETTVDWTQPEDYTPPRDMPGRVIGEGTIALQGHDAKSVVYYKNIMVRVPPAPID